MSQLEKTVVVNPYDGEVLDAELSILIPARMKLDFQMFVLERGTNVSAAVRSIIVDCLAQQK